MSEAGALSSVSPTSTAGARRTGTTHQLFRHQTGSEGAPPVDENLLLIKPAKWPDIDLSPTQAAESMLSVLPLESISTPESIFPDRRAKPTVTRVPSIPPADYRFDLLQQWEGVVQTVGEDEFTVVLRDLTDPSHAEEEAVLPLQDIAPEDRGLLAPGAILYWSIGYKTFRDGQVDRVSTIRFRRLPAWSRRDLERLDARAKSLMERFGSRASPQDASGDR